MTRHLSTLTLHQVRLGELDPDAMAVARDHLADCERCTARLGVQHRERAAFVVQPMPEVLRRPSARPATRGSWLRWLAPTSALLTAGLVLIVVLGGVPGGPNDGDDVRTRGELPQVEVWVDLGDGPRPLRPGEPLREGDRLQIRYDPRDARHVAIAGRDGSGVVEVYGTFPAYGSGLTDAPFGLALDDAPGEQEFFVVTADRALDEETVLGAVIDGRPDVDVVRTVVVKETP